MNKSESIKEIASALSKLQGEITNPKNTADNPFFKSKYAPLNDILTLARPLLSKHGLSIIQSPTGNCESITVYTTLLHSSGEWLEFEPLQLKADKPTAQGAGSAITYARRYAISAILAIASEDDDDGNHASGDKKQDQKQPPKWALTIEMSNSLIEKSTAKGVDLKVKGKEWTNKSSSTLWTESDYKNVLNKLNKEVKQ